MRPGVLRAKHTSHRFPSIWSFSPLAALSTLSNFAPFENDLHTISSPQRLLSALSPTRSVPVSRYPPNNSSLIFRPFLPSLVHSEMASSSAKPAAAKKNALPPTETEEIERLSRPLEGESVAASLRRVLLPLQNRRGAAYGRLRTALKDSQASKTKDLTQFRIEVAHVTEELTLVKEGGLALRKAIYIEYLPHSKQATKWLDRLHALEEKKLVSFISLNAIQRAKIAGTAPPQEDDEAETTDEKIARFTKELQTVDEEITDIIEEIREFISDQLDEEE